MRSATVKTEAPEGNLRRCLFKDHIIVVCCDMRIGQHEITASSLQPSRQYLPTSVIEPIGLQQENIDVLTIHR